ncbi:MAG: pitrilysin family protein [Pseudomonadota bacterium]
MHASRLLTAIGVLAMTTTMMFGPAGAEIDGLAARKAQTATLDNGLKIVVITDERAPVVTHMVWYKVGAADEPPGKSGIAHFLEHLMFKGTEKIASGEFSKIVAREGGQDNAFTGQDVTGYFQRVSKDRLALMMEMEADRMANLRLSEQDVLTERDVILEERSSRVDNRPAGLLSEEMSAALFRAHPYGTPIIGWEREIKELDRADALAFYEKFYAPNNATLIVAGDVTLEGVVDLAKQTYGKIAPGQDISRGVRPAEPPHRAPRRVRLVDERVGRPSFSRHYYAPSYTTAEPGQAEAMDLLMQIVGGSATSRLYQELVVKQGVASSASAYYSGSGLDSGQVYLSAVPKEGVSLTDLEAAVDGVIADIIENGVTEAEIKRARTQFLASFVYSNDSQSTLARRYGWALTTGSSLQDVEAWPERIQAVTAEDIKGVISAAFDLDRSVTGFLEPAPAAAANDNAALDSSAQTSTSGG